MRLWRRRNGDNGNADHELVVREADEREAHEHEKVLDAYERKETALRRLRYLEAEADLYARQGGRG